jgi:hypothetical protein
VADAWQPATDEERRMRDVLRDGDQESYFQVLAETELIVPVDPDLVDDVLSGGATPSWPTLDTDGRTNVPVYTSTLALRTAAGHRYQHFLKLKFAEVAAAWPDERWWLLVDEGLPIQAHLPSWFVKQLAAGDPRPPTAGRPAEPTPRPQTEPETRPETSPEPAAESPADSANADGEQDAEPDEIFVPSGEVEIKLHDAAQRGDNDAFLQALAESEVLLQVPEDAEFALRPGRPGFPWPVTEIAGRVSIPLFTSVERLRDLVGPAPAPAPYTRLPFACVIRYWPEASTAMAINPSTPVGAALPGEQIAGLAEWADKRAAQRMAQRFEPQNDVEQRLFEAAVRRDRDAFFKVLLGAQVVIPADPETPWGIRPREPDFPWHPAQVNGATAVQAFTSLRWMHDAIGPCRFLMPDFLDLVSAWPDPGWTLVLNPGTPIDATLPGEQVRALAGRPEPAPPVPQAAPPVPQPAPVPAAEAVPDFEPGNVVDEELFDAASRGDSDAFLRVLLSAGVLVPIPDDASPEIIPGDAEFRWDAAMRDAATAHVFTSYERLRESNGESRYVQAAFRELITVWPNVEWTMALNPGTRIGATLRGHQVRELSAWSVRVGLDTRATASAEPSAEYAVAPRSQASAAPLAVSSPAPLPAPTAEPAPEPPLEQHHPMIMQKVLPHGHVGWYLDQGYDRVGGYIHPAGDVTDLQTPAQLYKALGLLYTDSPFAAVDDGVYVIRWPAYCQDLYRIPFGGQVEADARAWGESGWVVEQPPFRGDGFAAGSGGTIRELKVGSVRLPCGAEMYYLGGDRTERFVAVYDPDRLTWLRPAAIEEGTS